MLPFYARCSSVFVRLLAKGAGIKNDIDYRGHHDCFEAPPPGNRVIYFYYYFFFSTLSLSSFWTSRGHRCHPFSSPVLAFNFCRTQGSSIPLLVDCSSNVANSRSRAFRKSICPQEKVPTLHEYALGGARAHETDLYQARG